MSIQKQSQANWVSEETIKQHHEKKLCIYYEISEHFKSNYPYCFTQQFIISIIIINTTTIVSETIICESDVMKINNLKKE